MIKKILKIYHTIFDIIAVFNFIIILSLDYFVKSHQAFFSGYVYGTFWLLAIYVLFQMFRKQLQKDFFRDHLFDIIIVIFFLRGFYIFGKELFLIYFVLRQIYFLIKEIVFKTLDIEKMWKVRSNPSLVLTLSFFVVILVGTFLLKLPISTVEGKTTTFIGALFTATSATCVTGLVVYDTGMHFTIYGQIIIMLLFQVGGLGIMTISTAFAILLGQKLSLKDEIMMTDVVAQENTFDMSFLIKRIFIVTILVELLGALMMYFTFSKTYTTLNAIYYSLFHSISAFCNAGFSLYGDSVTRYASSINMNLTVMSLIIIGGIGFSVIVDLGNGIFRKRNLKVLSVSSQLILICSAVLIIFGAIAFYIGEYNYTMKNNTIGERILKSLFQSVTTRTAGFNTIDNGAMGKSSVFVSIILMFIGASPGSTGGGIKTTSLIVVFLAVVSLIQGEKEVNVFRRRIPLAIVREVTALLFLAISLLISMVFLLLLIENLPFQHLIFEAVSAFATVGLSMGITADLTSLSKLIIVFLMFIGRIGPLTLVFALSKHKKKTLIKYKEEKIPIG